MNELIHDATLYDDIPEADGRLPREMAVYELLKELRIPYKRMDHEAMATIEACKGVDELLGITMCKNLFLCNTQKTQFYLLMMPGDKKFKTKELSKQIGSARLSFAQEEFMEEFLHISPGAVSVMGLMNDRENHVRLLIDEDVLKEEYLGCHPCVNTASLKIKTEDVIKKFLPYVKHEYTVVQLIGE
ncbi:MAG: prolyl-tRNA synthetase associated domain-containing protein [Lachnospiraceae bacterium]|nr:prolyl-tRNA synthetase associated domain-containing protein [Lachnospiraceae bacterium]